MATLKGNLQFTGSIEGLVAYKLNGKIVLRRKPNISRKKILKAPNYEGTRRQLSEFGTLSHYGKLFRIGLAGIYKQGSDSYAYQRLTKMFSRIKDLDTISLWGKRKISVGLQDDKAQELLISFTFDKSQPGSIEVAKQAKVDFEFNKVVFKKAEDLLFSWPKKADKASLQISFLKLNDADKVTELQKSAEAIITKQSKGKLELTAGQWKKSFKGDVYALLTVWFYKSGEIVNKGGAPLLMLLGGKSGIN